MGAHAPTARVANSNAELPGQGCTPPRESRTCAVHHRCYLRCDLEEMPVNWVKYTRFWRIVNTPRTFPKADARVTGTRFVASQLSGRSFTGPFSHSRDRSGRFPSVDAHSAGRCAVGRPPRWDGHIRCRNACRDAQPHHRPHSASLGPAGAWDAVEVPGVQGWGGDTQMGRARVLGRPPALAFAGRAGPRRAARRRHTAAAPYPHSPALP